jgi:transposase
MNQIILPLDLERKLEKEDIAFAIHDLVESIPEEAFQAFKQERGASKYHPRMMLKLILCAYTQSVFSGRKIEANANKYTFVWKKSIQNYDKKLTERSNDLNVNKITIIDPKTGIEKIIFERKRVN